MFNIYVCISLYIYLSKTPRCFFSEFQTTSMQVASLTGVRQSGQSCWIWNADATHRAWYVCPHSSVSQGACMCFLCEKSQPLKLGFGFEAAEFLHLISHLTKFKNLFVSSHSMFPHSHDLWNLPSHGDIQATDSWKHLALFCSLRQTAQRSSLRSRLAEPNIGVETFLTTRPRSSQKCEAEASLLCQKAENCSAPKANELLLVVSSCHPSGAHREPTLTSCQSGIMAGLLLSKWNAFKSHTPLEVAVRLAKKNEKWWHFHTKRKSEKYLLRSACWCLLFSGDNARKSIVTTWVT